jgi:hypothetical protein
MILMHFIYDFVGLIFIFFKIFWILRARFRIRFIFIFFFISTSRFRFTFIFFIFVVLLFHSMMLLTYLYMRRILIWSIYTTFIILFLVIFLSLMLMVMLLLFLSFTDKLYTSVILLLHFFILTCFLSLIKII